MVATTADNLIDTVLEVMPFGKSVSETMGLKTGSSIRELAQYPDTYVKKVVLLKKLMK